MPFAGAPVVQLVHVEQEAASRIDLGARRADGLFEYPALPAAVGLPCDPFARAVVEAHLDGLRDERTVPARHDHAAEGKRPRLVGLRPRVLLAEGLALLADLLLDGLLVDLDGLPVAQHHARLRKDLRRFN